MVLDADGDDVLFVPLDQVRDLKGKGQVPAFVRANLLAVDIDRTVIVGRADADEHALALPATRDVCPPDVPGQAKVAEEVFVLLVPTARHRDWAGPREAIEPPIAIADFLGIGPE